MPGALVCGIEDLADAYVTQQADARVTYGHPVERLTAIVEEEDAELLVVGVPRGRATGDRAAWERFDRRGGHRALPGGGDAADRLDDLASRESAELIVVGSRGPGRVQAALLGSVAGRLAGTACAPVVVLAPGVRLAAGSGEYEFREAVP